MNLSLKYTHLRQALIEQGLFEELNIDDKEFSENLSQFQDIFAETGASQESIDVAVEAIWLAVKLGVRNRDNASQVYAAFEHLEV